MKKKVLSLMLCGILLIVLTGCSSNKEEKIINDAKDECITDSMKTSPFEIWFNEVLKCDNDDECITDSMKILETSDFEYWYNEISKCDNNAFSSKVKELVNNLDYSNLKQYEKDLLDTYFLELFSEENSEVTTKDINNKKLKNVYWWDGSKYNEMTKLLYIIYEDESSYSYRFHLGNVSGNPISDDIENSFDNGNLDYYFEELENGSWNIYSVYKDNTSKFTFIELDSISLNDTLNKSNELLTLLKNYRDNVYKPIRDEEIKKEKEESKKEKEESKKEIEESKKSKSSPEIGMTASEVRASTWGEPDKINKDTYSWGVKEQWVYNDYGYVYFENGVVTIVSER